MRPAAPCLLDTTDVVGVPWTCHRCGYRRHPGATYRYARCANPMDSQPDSYHISRVSAIVPTGASGSQEARLPVYKGGAGGVKQ